MKLYFGIFVLISLLCTQVIAYESALQSDFFFKTSYNHQTLYPKRFLNPQHNENQQKFNTIAGFSLQYNSAYFLESELVSQVDNIIDNEFSDSKTSTKFKNRQIYAKWDINDMQFSLGRQRFNSGVSYFYQPLRLVRKTRNNLELESETGILSGQLIYFSDNASHQVTLFQPEQSTTFRQTFEQQSWAIDYLFTLFGDQGDSFFRLQTNENNTQVAFAFSIIMSDLLELHSEHRIYQGGWQFDINLPENNNRPLNPHEGIQITQNKALSQQHVIGVNYTLNLTLNNLEETHKKPSNWQLNVISEYLYNDNAPDAIFWSELNQIVTTHGQFGIPTNLLRMLRHDSPYRHSLFNRLALKKQLDNHTIEIILNWRMAATHQSYDHLALAELNYKREAQSIFDYSLMPDKIGIQIAHFLDSTQDGFQHLIPNQTDYQFTLQWSR